jgi:hypothetical protein
MCKTYPVGAFPIGRSDWTTSRLVLCDHLPSRILSLLQIKLALLICGFFSYQIDVIVQ